MSHAPLIKLAMAVVISLGLMGSGIYVLLTFDWGANPQMIAAATGWIGLVIGHWIR